MARLCCRCARTCGQNICRVRCLPRPKGGEPARLPRLRVLNGAAQGLESFFFFFSRLCLVGTWTDLAQTAQQLLLYSFSVVFGIALQAFLVKAHVSLLSACARVQTSDLATACVTLVRGDARAGAACACRVYGSLKRPRGTASAHPSSSMAQADGGRGRCFRPSTGPARAKTRWCSCAA